MVYPTGFEPAASRVGVLRSIQLGYGYIELLNYIKLRREIEEQILSVYLKESAEPIIKNNKIYYAQLADFTV